MKVACLQLSVGPNSLDNLPNTMAQIDEAAQAGAKLVLTPEGTNYIRSHDGEGIKDPAGEDPHVAAMASKAREHGIWLVAGSLLLRQEGQNETKKVNRQFLWNPKGELVSTYDKIHMFDVAVPDGQVYQESAHYAAGDKMVLSQVGDALKVGHTICYDLRFPVLFQQLALKGANLILVPAAFTAMTGALHWHTLLRARAIENGVFILAAGQTGVHDGTRTTFGHSLIIAPNGEILADAGEEPGIIYADLDLAQVAKNRSMIPNLQNIRPLTFGEPA